MNQRTRKLITIHKALHPRDDIDYMSPEKKEQEKSPALQIALGASIQGVNNSIKRRLITAVLATQIQREKRQKLGNRNGKKNICMDISSNKLARCI